MTYFVSTKTYEPGWSCAFRQWRASHSHCRFVHGYALTFRLEFAATDLDARNWVVDFGGLKTVKKWLGETFDHKLVVAADDPELERFNDLAAAGVADVVVVPAVGCEKFAEMVFDYVHSWLATTDMASRCHLRMVECREHAGNSAQVVREEFDRG